MSRRIRSIKPEWLEDERMASASAEARVLSIALMLLADDHGRGRAGRVVLAAQAFPGKPLETLDSALGELAGWFVNLYEVDDQHYFEIKNWAKHQKVDKPGKGRVPAPCAAPEKIPETVDDARASRGSRSYVPDPDPGPGPGPEASSQVRSIAPGTEHKVPTNITEALALPIHWRARALVTQPLNAQWANPQDWPENIAALRAFEGATGTRRGFSGPTDRGLATIAGFYAAELTQEQVCAGIVAVVESDWWRKDGASRGLTSISIEVLNRALQSLQTKPANDAAKRAREAEERVLGKRKAAT